MNNFYLFIVKAFEVLITVFLLFLLYGAFTINSFKVALLSLSIYVVVMGVWGLLTLILNELRELNSKQ